MYLGTGVENFKYHRLSVNHYFVLVARFCRFKKEESKLEDFRMKSIVFLLGSNIIYQIGGHTLRYTVLLGNELLGLKSKQKIIKLACNFF